MQLIFFNFYRHSLGLYKLNKIFGFIYKFKNNIEKTYKFENIHEHSGEDTIKIAIFLWFFVFDSLVTIYLPTAHITDLTTINIDNPTFQLTYLLIFPCVLFFLPLVTLSVSLIQSSNLCKKITDIIYVPVYHTFSEVIFGIIPFMLLIVHLIIATTEGNKITEYLIL